MTQMGEYTFTNSLYKPFFCFVSGHLLGVVIIIKKKTMAGNCLRSAIPVINRAASSRFIEFYDYKTEAIKKNPTVLFVPGFQSCGHGLKSQALIKHCQSKKLRYVCYDPEALG